MEIRYVREQRTFCHLGTLQGIPVTEQDIFNIT